MGCAAGKRMRTCSPAFSIWEMSSRLLTLTFDAHDPGRLARFWADLLGRAVVDDPRGLMLPGSDTQVGLRFTPSGTEKTGPNRVHLHLTSTTSANSRKRGTLCWPISRATSSA
jgi:hypothetical protein